MRNPWLKKNPFLSLWLSAANSVANTARAKATVAVRRQSAAAVSKASQSALQFWTAALTGAPKRRPKTKSRK